MRSSSERVQSSGRRRFARTVGLAMVCAGALAATAPAAMASPGQVVTSGDDGVTATQLAQALAGSGVAVSNVVYTGSPSGMGTFSGMAPVGFDSGVVLSSGRVIDVVGPNDSDSTSTSLGVPGDSDLNTLVAPGTTNDASVLEFDFTPVSNKVSFKYVFSSEEYNEFVGGSFDDVFAFFVNGVNCATVGGQRVSISTINGGANAALYRNNDPTDFPGGTPIDVEMDGLTTVLTCAADVNPGVPNSMKLAIGDTQDSGYDSAVFLQLDSLFSNTPPNCPSPGVGVPFQTPTAFSLGATDPDPGQTLTYVVNPPSNGTISGTAPDLTYTPNPGYTGNDQLTYTASDGTASCTGTVTFSQGAAPEPEIITPVEGTPPVSGDTITVKMCCFAPGTMVELFMSNSIVGAPPVSLGTFPVDSTGTVTASVQLPEGLAAGTYTLTMTGTAVGGAVVEHSTSITVGAAVGTTGTNTTNAVNFQTVNAGVTAVTSTTSAPLPPTGAETGPLAVLGAALIAGGIALLRISRRRLATVA